jgi:hypothetical protein
VHGTSIASIDRYLSARPLDLPDTSRKAVAWARSEWRAARRIVGASDAHPDLLTGTSKKNDAGQTKFGKGQGHRIAGITLSPATEIGQHLPSMDGVDLSRASACDYAGDCAELCLRGTGRQAFDYATLARVARTAFLLRSPEAFATLLAHELNLAAERFGPLALRPDVLSDLSWDRITPWLAELDSVEVVYGYTKNRRKARRWLALPGWHATFSASERNDVTDINRLVASGVNVAIPVHSVKGEPLPEAWGGLPVVDGDENDRRYLDPDGVVVLLRAKIGNGNRAAMTATPVSIRSFIKPLAA